MKQHRSLSYKILSLAVLLIWVTVLGVVLYTNQAPLTASSHTHYHSGAAVSGQRLTAADHPLGCQSNEIFLSAQAWWANATGDSRGEDGRLADDFGHLHTELCFPHKATIRGEMTLHINSILHDNPGELRRLMVQIYNDSEVERDSTLCGSNHAYACLNFRPSRTLENCEETGGRYEDGGASCSWWDTVTFDTSEHPLDGWQQIRVRGFVREPDGEEMRTSTGLHVYLDNGDRPVDHVYEDPDVVEARGWYGRDVNYTNAKIEEMPTEPVSGVWRPRVEMDEGAEGIRVTSHVAKLDANAHQGLPGITILEGDGDYEGRLTINTRELENGWHRLTLKANAWHESSGSTNSGIAVILFAVENNPPCQHNCHPAIQPYTPIPTPSPTPPFTPIEDEIIRVNFQPEGTQLVEGYLPDYGFTFNQRYGYSYGWSEDVSDDMKIRHTHEDPRLDTVAHILEDSHWEIAVPNGSYQVTVSVGDSVDGGRLHTVNVEGVNYWLRELLGDNEFRLKSELITITDGRLTIDQEGQDDSETHINYLEIAPSNPILIEQPSPAVLYVSTAGSDATGDGSLDNPYQTLSRAVQAAAPPTVIYARAGTYDAQNLFSPVQEQSEPIMIRPFPGEEVIFLTGDN